MEGYGFPPPHVSSGGASQFSIFVEFIIGRVELFSCFKTAHVARRAGHVVSGTSTTEMLCPGLVAAWSILSDEDGGATALPVESGLDPGRKGGRVIRRLRSSKRLRPSGHRPPTQSSLLWNPDDHRRCSTNTDVPPRPSSDTLRSDWSDAATCNKDLT